MRQPGRRSSASFVVVPDIRQRRPAPPERLSDEQKAIWIDITERLRPDWFQGTEHLLEIYCRALSLERFISQQIKATDPSDSQRLALLTRTLRDTAAVIATYATKMRLSQRSTYDRTAVKLAPVGPKPWELGKPSDDEPPPPTA
jgi:hypothetical protein